MLIKKKVSLLRTTTDMNAPENILANPMIEKYAATAAILIAVKSARYFTNRPEYDASVPIHNRAIYLDLRKYPDARRSPL